MRYENCSFMLRQTISSTSPTPAPARTRFMSPPKLTSAKHETKPIVAGRLGHQYSTFSQRADAASPWFPAQHWEKKVERGRP